jgi:hypothetical protein
MLFLSFRIWNWRKASVMLRPRRVPILFSGQVQPAYICLPSKLAARVGLAPTPRGLTGRRATFTLPGNCYLLFVVGAQ